MHGVPPVEHLQYCTSHLHRREHLLAGLEHPERLAFCVLLPPWRIRRHHADPYAVHQHGSPRRCRSACRHSGCDAYCWLGSILILSHHRVRTIYIPTTHEMYSNFSPLSSFPIVEGPRWTKGYSVNIAFICGCWVTFLAMQYLYKKSEKKRAERIIRDVAKDEEDLSAVEQKNASEVREYVAGGR